MTNYQTIFNNFKKYQQRLIDEVIPLYTLHNVVEGNSNFVQWSSDLLNFISTYIPSRLGRFNEIINKGEVIVGDAETPISCFWSKYGTDLIRFFDITFDEFNAIYKGDHGMTESIKRKVFVVHGRNRPINESFFQFLRALDLHPIEWSEATEKTGKTAPMVNDIIDVAFSTAQAIIILMTPDDEAFLRKEFYNDDDPDFEKVPTPQPRQNVVFEAGMAWQKDHNRTLIVKCGNLRPISDISGIHYVSLNNDSTTRKEVAQRLKTAGCLVNTIGNDWLKVGDFSYCKS